MSGLRRGARRGGLVRDGDERRALGLRQRAARARGRRWARSGSTWSRSRTPTMRCSSPARPAGEPPLLGARRPRRGCGAIRTRSSPSGRTSPCSTSLGTRPTRTRRGRASACRPRPSGRRRGEARRPRRLGGSGSGRRRDFPGYPGFRAFPYPEYSEVFFGSEYKVLRGGSWATEPAVARMTFRNWDFPIRRQIFAGFRCATRRMKDRVPPRPRCRSTSTSRRRTASSSARGRPRGPDSSPKELPPKWFYDERGSRAVRRDHPAARVLPHAPRAEILSERADDIARLTAANTLVEPGSGSSEKTRLLLDAMVEAGHLRRFVPFDVSEQALREAAAAVAERVSGHRGARRGRRLRAHLVLASRRAARRLFAFLGSPIGNLTRPAARGLPRRSPRAAGAGRGVAARHRSRQGSGADWRPRTTMRAGVTAEFNRNVLTVINRELGANFDPERLRARRAVGRGERVDRDAPPLRHRPARARRRSRPRGGVRGRRGDAHRDLATSSAGTGCRPSSQRRVRAAHWWEDPDGDFALSLSFSAADR